MTEQNETVHVVVTIHAADRGPRCEGVYREPEDAEKGKKEALALGALDAEIYEMEVR